MERDLKIVWTVNISMITALTLMVLLKAAIVMNVSHDEKIYRKEKIKLSMNENEDLNLAIIITVAVMLVDLVVVVYLFMKGCTELMSTKDVMNLKTYRGPWKMSPGFLDRIACIIPIILMLELISIVFMGNGSGIIYGRAHGFVIAYIVTYVFMIIQCCLNLRNLCKLFDK